jgi:hypothetical protein
MTVIAPVIRQRALVCFQKLPNNYQQLSAFGMSTIGLSLAGGLAVGIIGFCLIGCGLMRISCAFGGFVVQSVQLSSFLAIDLLGSGGFTGISGAFVSSVLEGEWSQESL